jgi:DNA-binding XRE family transcriptional regulator
MAYVYVLTNDLFPGLSKIGSCSDVQQEVRLIRAAMPGKSVLEWTCPAGDFFVAIRDMQSVLYRFATDFPGWYACPAGVLIDHCRKYLNKSDSLSDMDSLLMEDKKHISSVADLGAFCHTWRLQAGMSQQDLADHANVSLQFIVDLEDFGEADLPIGGCIRIAELLGIDLFATKR